MNKATPRRYRKPPPTPAKPKPGWLDMTRLLPEELLDKLWASYKLWCFRKAYGSSMRRARVESTIAFGKAIAMSGDTHRDPCKCSVAERKGFAMYLDSRYAIEALGGRTWIRVAAAPLNIDPELIDMLQCEFPPCRALRIGAMPSSPQAPTIKKMRKERKTG